MTLRFHLLCYSQFALEIREASKMSSAETANEDTMIAFANHPSSIPPPTWLLEEIALLARFYPVPPSLCAASHLVCGIFCVFSGA